MLPAVCKLRLLHYTATGAANPTAARGGCQTASLMLLQKSNCSVHRSTCATAAQLLLLCTEHYSLVEMTSIVRILHKGGRLPPAGGILLLEEDVRQQV